MHGARRPGQFRLGVCGSMLVALLALPALGPRQAAASAVKACKKSCKVALATCSRTAKGDRVTSRAACSGVSDAKGCRRSVKRLFGVARGACRTSRARCRACCIDGRTGCDVPPELPRVAGEFATPDRHSLDATALPPGPSGLGFMLLALPDGSFFFDPAARSPVSAAAECATAVLTCFHPTLRNWSGCFASVAVCETDTPWVGDHPMCCPARCGERFQELRAAGRSDPAAFAAAIWEEPSCMPALEGHVAEPRS